ncbi:helicase-related protein [Rhodococcus pyridinivorans]|uniref:helicase-related protein n=1 Tax=Rhodococcus pyridinivorans TaxID=103816 RepID=UPI001E319F5A|nr:helicase-related protein [Rhodococcus pyridinivorans]
MPLEEPPLNRIIVGVLHPQIRGAGGDDYRQGLAEDEALADGAQTSPNEGVTEQPVSLSRSVKPSSMGLTFAVDPLVTKRIVVHVSARRYQPNEDGSWNPVEVCHDHGLIVETATPTRINEAVADSSAALRIVGVVRAASGGLTRITLSLVNDHDRSQIEGHVDRYCWFRPQITVSVSEGQFVDRRRPRESRHSDEDARSAEFLYRSEPSLAIGHGCAVTWNSTVAGATELRTTFLPSHEVQLANPSGGDETDDFGTYDLRMDHLAEGSGREQLAELVLAYERWIAQRRSDAQSFNAGHRDVAREHLDQADRCAARIRAGINALDDPQIDRAFRLMNEAMVKQRDAQDNARGSARKVQRWRPFQIAFILMNIPGLANPEHDDRGTVDLLWFPTGGGKTEAYLGCIAFSILLRRIKRPADGGVSAIMRYTLRLLTRQQFERAAGLICALELLRREHLSESQPISLGLWVGGQATPNKIQDARTILKKVARGEEPDGSTPIQLLRCPWCGEKLDHENYDATGESLIISCGRLDCDFREGLPLHVIDSDIYRERPSLLIGTVDKFALMSWRPEIGPLLATDGPDSRPDLIVQDELHLISGPLGTMVGLYESVVDLACTGPGRPKVLASTATIRRAAQQVRAVFDRDAAQFPPPGLDPSDNYFAKDAASDEKGTRQYLGVMAPGTSQATLLVRIYSVLLQAVSDVQMEDKVRDTYWTLLGYFNSLRVLASTYLQVLDDVPDRMGVVAQRSGGQHRKISQEPVELTSRVDQTRIPRAMGALETAYPSEDAPDIVLATNMISVGLDIDRLGLMVVAGQPQSASEYIQSTSRVGRRYPGLVVVALNAQRSRDTSHYESFIPFHRALYREVEATTVTPFAPRARDRGAHGVLTAAVRLLEEGLRQDGSAVQIEKYRSEVERIIEGLVARAGRVAPEEAAPFAKQLRVLVETWRSAVDDGLVERYGAMKHPKSRPTLGEHPLLTTASDNSEPASYPVGQPPWPTLTSMRDVDSETHLYVKYLAGQD